MVCQVYVGICYLITSKALSILLTILLDEANEKLLEVVTTFDCSAVIVGTVLLLYQGLKKLEFSRATSKLCILTVP